MAKKPRKVADAAPVEEVVEVAATPVARTRGPRGVAETAIITLKTVDNPKRAGSKAHAAFSAYVDQMTVAEYCDAVGTAATPNLVYDAAHGFISIEGYNPAQVECKPKAEKVVKEPKAKKPKKEKAVQADLVEDAETAMAVEEETID